MNQTARDEFVLLLQMIADDLENTKVGRDDMSPEDAFKDATEAVVRAIRESATRFINPSEG